MDEEEEFYRQIRERNKKMDRWVNSLDGIYDGLKVFGHADEDYERCRILICKVLKRLPKRIRNEV